MFTRSLRPRLHHGRRRPCLRLEALEDRWLLAVFTVTSTADDGKGSLRQAIRDANDSAGLDTIDFAIASGPQTIALASSLPNITSPVVLDGTTQPGYGGLPLIELNGSAAGGGVSGLVLTAGDSTVRGLVINRFGGNGIFVLGKGNNVLEGNYLGTDAAGKADRGNLQHGVRIDGSSANRVAANLVSGNDANGILIIGATADQNVVQGNYVGTDVTGTAALPNTSSGISVSAATNTLVGGLGFGEPNVFSGNTLLGVILGAGATGTQVIGNFIGTDVVGAAAVGNRSDGVRIDNSGGNVFFYNLISGNNADGLDIRGAGSQDNLILFNLIGTDASGAQALGNGADGVYFETAFDNTVEGNVISGNRRDGVFFVARAGGNVVRGNLIGTDITGTAPLGNVRNGVGVLGLAGAPAGNTIGDASGGNVIAFNGGVGVLLFADAGTANRIRGNAIHSNGGLGIDLGNDGVTPNDKGDGDNGPNGLQNFPVLAAALAGNQTVASGTLNSRPATTFTLDFYASAVADPSGFGQGERYLGSAKVLTGEDGNINFEVILAATTAGEMLTVTATDPDGNTSEFSEAILVQTPGAPGGSGGYGGAWWEDVLANRTDAFFEMNENPATRLGDVGILPLRRSDDPVPLVVRTEPTLGSGRRDRVPAAVLSSLFADLTENLDR